MVLHLKAEKGSGWSEKDLDKVLSQVTIIPDTVDGMIHNIHNTACLSELFFGPQSLCTVGLRSWHQEIASDLTAYEAQALSDQSFISKVLVVIDKRVNCWLLDCMSKDLRCNVDDTLVNFSDMHRSIRVQTFNFILPPSIRNHSSKRKRQDDETPTETKKNPTSNPNQNPQWKLRDGEDYRQIFAGKNLELRPAIDGKPACTRWNVKGVCFTSCPQSHAPLHGNNKAAYDKFVKKCRGE